MGTITIYRLTNPGDTINNVTDKIVFNSPTGKSTKNSNAFITDYEINGQSGVGDNQSVAQDTAGLQPLGKVQDLYTFYGYISKLEDLNGFNAFTVLMSGWDGDPKVNPTWPEGRFGVSFSDFHAWDVVPQGLGAATQIGLIWQNLQWKNNWKRVPTQGNFILTMMISRSNGT